MELFHNAPNQPEQSIEQQQDDKGTDSIPDTHVGATGGAISDAKHNEPEYFHDHKEYILKEGGNMVDLRVVGVDDVSSDKLRLHHAERFHGNYQAEIDDVQDNEDDERNDWAGFVGDCYQDGDKK